MSLVSLRKLITSPATRNVRSITVTAAAAGLKQKDPLPTRPTLPDVDLQHVYLKGSGPGGQKINKTSSACQMTHLPTGIVVKSQATRSRSENYKIARRILAEKIELREKGGESRVAKKEERISKKKSSREKKSRRKYRALEAGRVGGELTMGQQMDKVGQLGRDEDDQGSAEDEETRSPQAK